MTTSRVTQRLAQNRLRTHHVVFFILSAAAPLYVVAAGATTSYAVTGVLGLPLAYIAIALVLALFTVGYVAMSRRITNAGSFYSYVAQGLTPVSGVGASFVALVAYNAMQIAQYGAFGVIASGMLGGVLPWWACALMAWLAVGVLGLLWVDLNGRVLALLLSLECVIAVVFGITNVAHPAGGIISFETLHPSQALVPGFGAIFPVVIAGFVGFEGGPVFAEETRDPRRTIRQATYLSIVFIGVLYAFSAWAMSVATGPENIAAQAEEHQTELLFVLAAQYLPSIVVEVGHVLLLTSVFAALVSFHNFVARYGYALGRERVLPRILGRTHYRTGSPYVGSLLQSTLALLVIGTVLLTGIDPLTHLFFWGGTWGSLGVLLLMTTASVAVLGYFRKVGESGESPWTRTAAPALAAVLLGVVLVMTVVQYDRLLSVDADSPARWVLPGLYVVSAVAGCLWGWWIKRNRPDVYSTIGLGVHSSTGPRQDGLPVAHDVGPEPDPAPVGIERVTDPEWTDALAPVIAEAFFEGDPAPWLVPDPSERRRIYHDYFRMIVRHALSGAGEVYTSPDRNAVAIWFPALTGPPNTVPPAIDRRLDIICGPYARRFQELAEKMEQAHPTEPHLYLNYLAVGEGEQNKGWGTALLRHRLAELDQHGIAAYLEATNERNLGLYLRHGFEVSDRISLYNGPSLYPMWRPPRSG